MQMLDTGLLVDRMYHLLAEIDESSFAQNPLIRKLRLKLAGRLAVAIISDKSWNAPEVEGIVSDLFEGIKDPVSLPHTTFPLLMF
jgi:hypothetical protein